MEVNELNSSFEIELSAILNEMKEFLLKKNEAYGDSAMNPIRLFSKASSMEQLNVRIDDKLSRIMNRREYESDDSVKDLLGYLIIHRMMTNRIPTATFGYRT